MRKKIKFLTLFFMCITTLSLPETRATDHELGESQENSLKLFTRFSLLPSDIQDIIVILSLNNDLENIYKDGHAGNKGSVCKDWFRRIKKDRPSQHSFYQFPHSAEESCQIRIFLSGELVFTCSPTAQIVHKVSDLTNPLGGTFNISLCKNNTGEEAKDYVTVSTGYHTEYNPANVGKFEMWLVPRLIIKRELENNAKHFQAILPKHNPWGAPIENHSQYLKEHFSQAWPIKASIGFLVRNGSWRFLDAFDYLITNNLATLSKKTFRQNWEQTRSCNHAHTFSKREDTKVPDKFDADRAIIQMFTIQFPEFSSLNPS